MNSAVNDAIFTIVVKISIPPKENKLSETISIIKESLEGIDLNRLNLKAD